MSSSTYHVQASNNTGSSYQGVIDALNSVRSNAGELPRYYPPNYQGIIQAILDLKKWGQSDEGDLPPGWVPIEDENGNIIGGNWSPEPADGTLWFDTRQGRLFIYMDDGFYQCNGADGIAKVGEDVPDSEVPGTFWYNTTNGNLYIWDGSDWTVVGGATGVTNTASLPLSNPTRDALAASASKLPPTSGLTNQSHMNTWVVDAVQALDQSIGEAGGSAEIIVSETAPAIEAEGNLWFNSSRLELMVAYDNFWIPTAIPLSNNADFVDLSSTVQTNHNLLADLVASVSQRISTLEYKPLRQLSIDVDHNEKSINFNDNEGNASSVKFAGNNGISINTSYGCITVDATQLHQSIENLSATKASTVDLNALSSRTTNVEYNVSALVNETRVTPAEVQALTSIVNSLPTSSTVNSKVDKALAVFTNDVDINGYRVKNVANPASPLDGVNRAYVDSLRTYADNQFVSKSASQLDNITIQRSDLNKPAIDFSSSHTNGANAFKFKTFGGAGSVTFGATTNPNEYAWQFTGAEEFAWIGTNGKAASINHSGLTAKDLFLGTNKIDVRERITTYETALQGIRQALATASDFDEFKAAAHTALSNI